MFNCCRITRCYALIVVALGIFKTSPVWGQPYPVSAIVQVVQFSPLPEAYDDPGRVIITLISTDARPEYPAILRIKLSGPGFSITTREDYLPSPLVLRRNQPVVLTGVQLQEYFDPSNLNFTGIEPSNLLSGTGMLPEGPVSLCVEVFDYNRFFDPAVSNTGCANGFMQLHRPPVLIEPGGEVTMTPIQQVRFVWQPMHAGVNAEYTLEIYENNLAGFSPDLILEATPPIAVVQTVTPFYLYTNLDPVLLPGQDYLVRIRAHDVVGQVTFINDGWSEIYTFHYGSGGCSEAQPARDLAASIVAGHRADLSWRSPDGLQPDTWFVSYRKQDDLTFGVPVSTEQTVFSLQGLTPATPYEARVCYTCTTPEDRCETVRFTTPGTGCALGATDNYSYSCGDSTAVQPPGEVPLVSTLQAGDTVWAGDFLVILSEVSGAGPFRGTGYVSAPFFDQARLRLSFNNIRVNEHCRMVAGHMDVTGAGLAALDRLNELIDQIMDQLDELDNILTQVEEALLIAQEIVDAAATLADYNQARQDALAAIAQASAEFPFLPDSLSQHIQEALECMNSAETEAAFSACREQMMAALTAYQAAVNALYQNAPFQVQFSGNQQQKYGFDTFSHEVHNDHYTHLSIANQPYHVPWKSALASGTDWVNAQASSGLTGISFVNKNRALLPRTDSSGVATVTVTGGTYDGPAGVVYALHRGEDSTDIHIAGQLHIAAYPEKRLNIVLIPVNGATAPEGVADALKNIFKQAVVRPEISIRSGFQLPEFNGILSDAPSGLFASYNADMRAIIRGFEQISDNEPDTYYIFLVPGCSSPSRLGFMPRGRKHGFVFLNNHTSGQASVARTIAHELAHGAYYLRHTFEQFPGLSAGSTHNLMDYAVGAHLHKYQWDLIHNPDQDWGIFEEDEDNAGETAVIARNFIYSGNIYYEYTGNNPHY
ncbi:MAG: fibronectin type III domain-containing protein, partial [Saprospiraceae bacterium]|nr:fibronectin type III domain-containing protein [Saprospiraceae bacterium]